VTIEKALQWATLATVLLGLAGSAATCSRAFDKLENHEKRLVKIEEHSEERDESLRKTLGDIKDATSYLNWRMDSVVKQLDKTEKKR
jgi:hypothetical protein